MGDEEIIEAVAKGLTGGRIHEWRKWEAEATTMVKYMAPYVEARERERILREILEWASDAWVVDSAHAVRWDDEIRSFAKEKYGLSLDGDGNG